MKVLHVVGARPNFMKVAPVMAAIRAHEGVRQLLVHTGQHYDVNMSEVFFRQLGIPQPDFNLGVGSGSHAFQCAEVMVRFEPIAVEQRPDLVLVYGDVNSTVSTALVCAKLLIPLGHVEAGLRSFDRTMPEEINRMVTDRLADLLFTPSEDGDANLLREGVPPERIHRVGNVMIDTLIRLLPLAQDSWKERWEGVLGAGRFGLVTLHRPSNVDDGATLERIVHALGEISASVPLLFPVHPRTRGRLEALNVAETNGSFRLMDPLGYLDFLAIQSHACLVITDSGGVQEESTFLGIPCMTVRGNTERPITVSQGTNVLVGNDMERLKEEVGRALRAPPGRSAPPPLWDGKAGERIAEVIRRGELRPPLRWRSAA